jgi:hypothetical protein
VPERREITLHGMQWPPTEETAEKQTGRPLRGRPADNLANMAKAVA